MDKQKKVLVLCTGNSCRSIMAEALVNAKLSDCVKAFSSGVKASGAVNTFAKKILKRSGLWRDEYHSKNLNEVINNDYDLIVTVCDNAKENCPIFPKKNKTIHIGFVDPSGKDEKEYEKTLMELEDRLLPVIKQMLCS